MTGDQAINRIAMWSGPRNISTALMRAFENRPDCVVVDEPFYAYYLHETGLDHPGREQVLASQPTAARDVIRDLMGPLPSGTSLQYQKHMSQHMLDDTPMDWIVSSGLKLHHCILLRDPAAMVASYVKSRADVTLRDMGILQLGQLFNHITDKTGTAPLVVDSDDILKNPEAMLRLMCRELSIPFDAAMLKWPAGPRDTDGVWAPYWYKNVERSTGFEPRKPHDGALPPALQAIADAAQPTYDMLVEHKISLD